MSDKMERKDFKFAMQDEPDEKGVFRGHASVFNELDSYGEMVDEGAFKKTLKENKFFPLLDTHDVMRRLGIISGVEDGTGLLSEGHFNLDVQAAREARSLAKQGAFTGLSIGFQTMKEKIMDGVRHLKEIKLWEISLCVFQACPGALIEDVKSGLPLTMANIHKALIGWTTDSEFKVSNDELPLLKSAGESIAALIKLAAPGATPPSPAIIEPQQQDNAGTLSAIAGLNDVLKKANQTLGGLNG
jgi:HK97 family phage prohead protease